MNHFLEPAFQCFFVTTDQKKTENHPRIPFSHINDDKHCYRNKNSSNMEIMYAERDILLYLTFFSLLVVFRFRGILLSLCRGWPTIDAVLYAIWKMRHSWSTLMLIQHKKKYIEFDTKLQCITNVFVKGTLHEYIKCDVCIATEYLKWIFSVSSATTLTFFRSFSFFCCPFFASLDICSWALIFRIHMALLSAVTSFFSLFFFQLLCIVIDLFGSQCFSEPIKTLFCACIKHIWPIYMRVQMDFKHQTLETTAKRNLPNWLSNFNGKLCVCVLNGVVCDENCLHLNHIQHIQNAVCVCVWTFTHIWILDLIWRLQNLFQSQLRSCIKISRRSVHFILVSLR